MDPILKATCMEGLRLPSREPERVRAHVWISGTVQGVGYRAATARTANRLGLSGWVRNLPDGRVEAIFEGPLPRVQEAVAWCRRGPRAAIVQQVRITWEPPQDIDGFEIRT